jgi:hypothetical protein
VYCPAGTALTEPLPDFELLEVLDSHSLLFDASPGTYASPSLGTYSSPSPGTYNPWGSKVVIDDLLGCSPGAYG